MKAAHASLVARFGCALLGAAGSPVPDAARAAGIVQNPVDRADPSVVEDQLGNPERRTRSARERVLPAAPPQAGEVAAAEPIVAGALRVDGATALRPAAFAAARR